MCAKIAGSQIEFRVFQVEFLIFQFRQKAFK